MKLMRLEGEGGRAMPCVMDQDGKLRDAGSLAPDFDGRALAAGLVDALRRADTKRLPVIDPAGRRIAPPIAQPPNIWCIGLNYSDHAAEAGLPVPTEPILFNKSSATFCGPEDPILYAPHMSKLDWEVELGVVIGKQALGVSPEAALSHVAGYVVVNDVSERSWQMERGGQWVKGKSYPNFCPVGPWLVTADEIADPGSLDLWLEVNGRRMQTGSTSKMIFDVATIISYMSTFCRLEPGDLILTGTPPGVGAGMKPPVWLAPGDEVRLGITGIGEQCQRVVPVGQAV